MNTVFMFRRDLRLDDNTGLLKALEESDLVIPVFIFNPAQIENNQYKGEHSFEFLLNSLKELDEELRERGSKLYCFYGNPVEVLEQLDFETLYFNKDYTPFSIFRDTELAENFSVITTDDIVLNAPDVVKKNDGTPYTVFTPYHRKASMYKVRKPQECVNNNFFSKSIDGVVSIEEIREKFLETSNPHLAVSGGRNEALKLVDEFNSTKYEENRDVPFIDATSKLSAHNKFGTVSPRELFYWISSKTFRSQLYWRDFFTQIAYHFPYVFGNNFNSKFDGLEWNYNREDFNRWCRGETGFPIVDAGMRELNQTGYMHNRVRMIVSSFLTKDLHIDWRWGEKYFAQKLVDYDPCVNNGSWQWASSTGCDAQPYFRIFNPFRQQIRFDPECRYIKYWIPELKDFSAKDIHQWGGQSKRNLETQGNQIQWNRETQQGRQEEYPKPMVDHFVEKEETLRRFKNL